ncbi:heptaprenyl diphosphate synthase component 1 [Bacillus luteolus]|uniref:Heptaprenyl diphosphate synthase component 1 n=1 Tax=Litchfieldia luteola TaxID=682179 RepID=A0ABR9QP56_9BACI|nr:heptaprenyl diphosphate synthase component 1 [Cytobacillus luteolus]MBE4910290.1 heptaprenyl diphosphate synthase component 1 [Cytobacillus luteolus]MBP1942137.1 heptaprenyl diphosphate synthase [Cytobacillus luteolus]
MILLQDFEVKIAELKELIQTRISYPFINKYIETPIIDEDRLILLYLIFDDLQLPSREVERYTITSMLVQMALDTHETVSNSVPQEKSDRLTSRQLTVLAGDYYSSLYYYLLADIDDINFIRILAEAIKDINENKIIFYQSDAKQFETFIHTVELIECAVFRKITGFFQIPSWNELTSKVLLLKRLLLERENLITNNNSLFIDTMRKLFMEQESNLLNMMDTYIRDIEKAIETNLMTNFKSNSVLSQRVNALLHSNNSR